MKPIANFASTLLRELREESASDTQTPRQPAGPRATQAQVEAAIDARPPFPRTPPPWAVAECAACERYFRPGEYLRCKLCQGAVCKTGNCKSLHGASHRAAINPTASPTGDKHA